MRKTGFQVWLERMGYSQKQAAKVLGASDTTVGRWARGYRHETPKVREYPPLSIRQRMLALARGREPEAWPMEMPEAPKPIANHSVQRTPAPTTQTSVQGTVSSGHKEIQSQSVPGTGRKSLPWLGKLFRWKKHETFPSSNDRPTAP